jgi:hypothetical protein
LTDLLPMLVFNPWLQWFVLCSLLSIWNYRHLLLCPPNPFTFLFGKWQAIKNEKNLKYSLLFFLIILFVVLGVHCHIYKSSYSILQFTLSIILLYPPTPFLE